MQSSVIISNPHVQFLNSSGNFTFWVGGNVLFISNKYNCSISVPTRAVKSITSNSVTVSVYTSYACITCWLSSPLFTVNMF